MKKLLLILTILALICCLGTAVFAAEGDGETGLTTTTTEDLQTTVDSETTAETAPDSGLSPFPEDEPSAEGETPDDGETTVSELKALIEELKALIETEEPSNVAEWVIYKLFGDWAPIVYLVLVAALGVFLILLEVKKRLPADKEFRKTISEGLSAFTKDSTDTNIAFTGDITAKVNEMKKAITEALDASAKAVELVLELQKEQKTSDKDREVLKTILTNETEMLNTIIQASTLAQWRKDEIGEMHKQNVLAIADMTIKTDTPDTDTTEGGEDA